LLYSTGRIEREKNRACNGSERMNIPRASTRKQREVQTKNPPNRSSKQARDIRDMYKKRVSTLTETLVKGELI
jgi:hypothetical protein